MILYPAIDLKDGKAVRLLRGDMNKSTVFNDSPVDQALSFVNQGCAMAIFQKFGFKLIRLLKI